MSQDARAQKSPDGTQPPPDASASAPPSTIADADAWQGVRQALAFVDRLHQASPSYSARDAFAVNCSVPQPGAARAAALRSEARDAARDIGLDAEARYGTESATIVGAEGSGLSGTYAGLSWDLLSGGLWDSLHRDDLLDTRATAERLRGELTHLQRTEACRAQQVRRKFDVMDDSLAHLRVRLGRTHQQLVRKAYLNGTRGLERLLEVQAQVEAAHQRRRALQRHPPPPPPAFRHFPPLWDLDFAALGAAQHGDSLRQRLGAAARAEVRLEDRLASDARLSAFSRYRMGRLTQQDGLEVGLSVRYPLSSLWSGDGVAATDRIRALQQQEQRALEKQNIDLEEIQDQFEAAQRGALRAHYQAMEVRERVRRQLVLRTRTPDAADLDRALAQGQQLLTSVFEKIEAYREVHVLIGRAFRAAREPFDPRLLQPQDVRPFDWRGRTGHRALYVWSGSIQQHSVPHMLNLAQAQGIERLIVSAGRAAPAEKRAHLRAEARAQGLNVETLLGANGWVRSGGVDRARQRISGLNMTGGTLHLDVEPHALDDFDARQEAYLTRYLDVIRAAQDANPGDSLAVSVPLRGVWPQWVYEELRPLVDRVYLMAYGQASPRERARRALETARLFAPEQRAVALRPSDVADGWALEQTITAVSSVVGTNRVAIHDFASFSSLVRADQ